MTKNIVLGYGNVDIPTNVELGNVIVSLLNSNGVPTLNTHVPYGTPSVNVEVTSGTGWSFQVKSLDSLGNPLIGTSAFTTDTFDVVETKTVSVVVSAALA